MKHLFLSLLLIPYAASQQQTSSIGWTFDSVTGAVATLPIDNPLPQVNSVTFSWLDATGTPLDTVECPTATYTCDGSGVCSDNTAALEAAGSVWDASSPLSSSAPQVSVTLPVSSFANCGFGSTATATDVVTSGQVVFTVTTSFVSATFGTVISETVEVAGLFSLTTPLELTATYDIGVFGPRVLDSGSSSTIDLYVWGVLVSAPYAADGSLYTIVQDPYVVDSVVCTSGAGTVSTCDAAVTEGCAQTTAGFTIPVQESCAGGSSSTSCTISFACNTDPAFDGVGCDPSAVADEVITVQAPDVCLREVIGTVTSALECFTDASRVTLATAYTLGAQSYCTFTANSPDNSVDTSLYFLKGITVTNVDTNEPFTLFDRGVVDLTTNHEVSVTAGELDFDWTLIQERLPSLVLGISTTPYRIECVTEYLPSGLVRRLATRTLQTEEEVSSVAGVATLSVEQPANSGDDDDWWIPLVAAMGAAAGCSIFVIGALWRKKKRDEEEEDVLKQRNADA